MSTVDRRSFRAGCSHTLNVLFGRPVSINSWATLKPSQYDDSSRAISFRTLFLFARFTLKGGGADRSQQKGFDSDLVIQVSRLMDAGMLRPPYGISGRTVMPLLMNERMVYLD